MMKRTKVILKAAAVCCVLWMLQTPMIVRADLIWEPIEEELIIYEENSEEGNGDVVLAGTGVAALVAATGVLTAVLFKKKKNDKGEE